MATNSTAPEENPPFGGVSPEYLDSVLVAQLSVGVLLGLVMSVLHGIQLFVHYQDQSARRKQKDAILVKVDIALYNVGYVISTAFMLGLYKQRGCQSWFTVFNIYYIINSFQLYRLLLNKAKMVDVMNEHETFAKVTWWLVHGVHLPGAMGLALLSVFSPYSQMSLHVSPAWD
uniref:Uncharacterized protein n=1 Tax=Lotharella globosa TaxID=91324 RepID=A0A6V3KLM1_9EUKA